MSLKNCDKHDVFWLSEERDGCPACNSQHEACVFVTEPPDHISLENNMVPIACTPISPIPNPMELLIMLKKWDQFGKENLSTYQDYTFLRDTKVAIARAEGRLIVAKSPEDEAKP